jgi:uncharacterized membrane protein YhhN
MLVWILLTLVATALLLVAEANGSAVGRWLAKPVASTGFVATALAAGAWETTYGRLVLLALVLSWWGDVLLIPRRRAAFAAGLAGFLGGHLAFAAAFLARGVSPTWLVAVLVLLAPPALAVDRWLGPSVPERLRVPVRAYVAAICFMVATAVATWASFGCAWIPLGALMFFVSDLSVARDRFVAHELVNRLWGLPLYYGGQLFLAASASATGS